MCKLAALKAFSGSLQRYDKKCYRGKLGPPNGYIYFTYEWTWIEAHGVLWAWPLLKVL